MSKADEVIKIAESYLGTEEGSQKHKEIISYYNNCRYVDAYKMTMNDPWCAAFVVACFGRANCPDLIPCVASCDQMISWFKKWGRYSKPSNTAVTRGSILFYDWNNDGGSDHVGIVTNNSMGDLQVIEGNKSDSVGYRSIRISDPRIVGVGMPHYGAEKVSQLTDQIIEAIRPLNQYTEYYSKFSYEDRKTIFSLPLLKKGSSGVYVQILQILLKYKGHFSFDVTGQFDEETNNVVLSWQLIKNLETDGVVGRETWSSLLI